MLRALYPLAKAAMVPLWWTVAAIRGIQSALGRPHAPKRVLFVLHNELMARYLREIADLVRDDPRLELRVTRAPFVDRSVPTSAIVRRIEVEPISFVRALLGWWDLIVAADHYPAGLFHPRIRKLFTSHGLFAGIMMGGSSYEYGARARGWRGRAAYSAMLAAGPLERACAAEIHPDIAHTVRVVGSIGMDRLRERNREREDVRARLGFSPGDRVVLIMSSWGEDSLIETLGPEIVAAARAMRDPYRFVLSLHPNNYSRSASGTDWRAWAERQRSEGLHLIGEYEPWGDYVVAADVAVADRTSMGLYFALLEKPIVFVPLDLRGFVPGSPTPKLYERSVTLSDPARLAETVEGALAAHRPEEAARFAREVVAHPGEAATRVRRLVMELVGLEDAER